MTDSDISELFSTPATTPRMAQDHDAFFDFGEFDFLSAFHVPDLPQIAEAKFPTARILDLTDDDQTAIQVPKCKKQVLIGNNRYGKKGKLRCEQCRAWKQKCEYQTLGSRCTYCQRKDLHCGPKVSAPGWRNQQLECGTQKSQITVPKPDKVAITRVITRPSEDNLNAFEERHMKSIHKGDFLFTFALLQVSRTDGHRLSDCLFRRFGLYLSSKPVRYSCIVYSSFKAGDITNQPLRYLDGFYQTMRNAIERKDFADVAYGCFIACMYALKVRRPFEEIANHAKAFRLAVYQIKRTVVDEETFLWECMWEKLLWHMGRQIFFRATPTVECLNQLAEFAHPLGLSDYKNFDVWIQDSFQELGLKYMFMRFIISLDLLGTKESKQLKATVVKHFWRDWTLESPVGSRNRTQIRRISRNLWSGLVKLLWDLTHLPFISTASLNTIVSGIHSTVDSLHEHVKIGESPIEFKEVLELAWNCLTLIGLVICDVQPTNTCGIICF